MRISVLCSLVLKDETCRFSPTNFGFLNYILELGLYFCVHVVDLKFGEFLAMGLCRKTVVVLVFCNTDKLETDATSSDCGS